KTTMRSLRVSRKLLIKLLPISTLCQKPDRKGGQRCPCLRAGFRHDTCKSPALANNAGLSSNCFEQRLKVAELFSRLFFVAASRLNSPRFFQGLLKHRATRESRELPVISAEAPKPHQPEVASKKYSQLKLQVLLRILY